MGRKPLGCLLLVRARDLPAPHGEKVLPFDNWLTAQEVFLARYNIIMRDMALGGASGVSA